MPLLTPRKCVRTAGGRMEEGHCLFSRNSQKMFKSKVEKNRWFVTSHFWVEFFKSFFILTNKHMHERNDRVKNCPVAVDRYFTRRNVKGIAWAAWQIWLSDIEISGLANWCEDMAFLTFEDWDVRLLAKKPSKYFQPWQVWKGSFTSTFQFGQWPRWGSHGHLMAIFKMDPGEGTTRFATGDHLRCRLGCALTGFYG